MSLNIGVFTLMSDIDCVPVATHIANFIADGNHSVALKEEIAKEALFETAKADFDENGTFTINGVRYYPKDYQEGIEEDTIVTVFGEVGFLQTFADDFAKLYLVCKGRVENKVVIDQFLVEMPPTVRNNIELILLGASKEELSYFLSDYRCTSISEFHSNVCPYNLSFRVASIFAERGLPRPVYHKDWIYEEVTYHYVPEPEKQKLFGRFGSKKKKKQMNQEQQEQQAEETIKEPETIISDIQVHEKKVVSEANEFSDVWEVIDVPAPVLKSVTEQNPPSTESAPQSEPVIEQIAEPEPETAPKKLDLENGSEDESDFDSEPEAASEMEPAHESEVTTKEPEEKTPKKARLRKEKNKKEKSKREGFIRKKTKEETIQVTETMPASMPEIETIPTSVPETAEKVISELPKEELLSESKQEERVTTVAEVKATKPAFADKKRPVLFGRRREKGTPHIDRLNVFVSGIDHSVGTSYVAGSLASAITDIYNIDVWLDHKGMCSIPDNYMVHEVTDEVDRFNAYKSGIIVQDRGVYDELSIMDRNEMMHADMNIMVSTAEEMDLRKVAQFIDLQGQMIRNWMFVFNHVLDHQRHILEAAMRDYAYIIVPFHDNAEVPNELLTEWKDAIDYFTK